MCNQKMAERNWKTLLATRCLTKEKQFQKSLKNFARATKVHPKGMSNNLETVF